MIKLKNISKKYYTDEIETTALNQISIDINKGEFVAIMGPSGCGKSTLLNILGLLDGATSGEYFFFDEEVSNASESRLSEIRKNNIGFIFQNFNLIDELTVYENIALALLYTGTPYNDRKKRVNTLLEKLGIAHRSNHRPNQLSGGQQQRVAFARALASSPSIILADEPTGNLDSLHGEEIMNMLQALNEEGNTIVMVTHSSSHANYARRIINLFDGQIIITQKQSAVA